MIRINLLPQKRRTERGAEGSQVWLFVILGIFLVEIAGFVIFHLTKVEELEGQLRTNKEIQSQIDQAKATVANHDQVKAQLADLRKREDAIAALQSARTGPTAMLLELARLLTPGRGPTVDPEQLAELRRDNPLAVFNPSWDARRLWLTEFVEENRLVRLKGQARDGEDVSELARRMSLSSYFQEVKLLPGSRIADAKSGLELVQFELEAKVRY